MDTLLSSFSISICKTCNRLHTHNQWSRIYQFIGFAIYKSLNGEPRWGKKWSHFKLFFKWKASITFLNWEYNERKSRKSVFMVECGENLHFKACTERGCAELPQEEGSPQVSYLIQPSHNTSSSPESHNRSAVCFVITERACCISS